MADFSTVAQLEVELDQRSVRQARRQLEKDVGGVGVRTDGGAGGMAGLDEVNENLEDIKDLLERGVGGRGGGGGSPVAAALPGAGTAAAAGLALGGAVGTLGLMSLLFGGGEISNGAQDLAGQAGNVADMRSTGSGNNIIEALQSVLGGQGGGQGGGNNLFDITAETVVQGLDLSELDQRLEQLKQQIKEDLRREVTNTGTGGGTTSGGPGGGFGGAKTTFS